MKLNDHNNLISLAAAARLPFLPRRSNGKPIHVSTLYRWSSKGIDGRVLRTVKVGRTRCTTKSWLREFSPEDNANPCTTPLSRTTRERIDHRAERDAREILGLPSKNGGDQ